MYLPLIKQANDLLNLLRYIGAVIGDGDYLNDWLTHLPIEWRDTLIEIGMQLADVLH